jgi:hypothetical protein
VGATISYVINFDAAFKSSGADISFFYQAQYGGYTGDWNCFYFAYQNTTYTPGTDTTVTCNPITSSDLNVAASDKVNIGLKILNKTPAGTLTIKSATINLAP